MSLVAFTFGSFGDIIALVQFVVAAITALDDSRGSAKEYQRLALYLTSFSGALDALKTEHTDVSPNEIEESLKFAIEASYDLLLALNQEIRKYESRLRPGGSSSRTRDIMAKLVWIWKKREIEHLQRQLAAHVDLIMLCSKSVERKEIQRLQEHIDTKMMEQATWLADQVRTLLNFHPSRQIGPRSLEIEAVFLTTMLGRTIQVPFYCCSSYGAFHLFLRSCFQRWPGKAIVDKLKYLLTTGGPEQTAVITKSVWNCSVRPGTLMHMSAILQSPQQVQHLPAGDSGAVEIFRVPDFRKTRMFRARCVIRMNSENQPGFLSTDAIELPLICHTEESIRDLKNYEQTMGSLKVLPGSVDFAIGRMDSLVKHVGEKWDPYLFAPWIFAN